MPGKLMHSTPGQRTNTLIITQLPAEFFHSAVLDALRDHFSLFGPLHTWAPIRAFNRAILVYFNEDDAERVKQHCDGLTLDDLRNTPRVVLRVFRANPTPISPPKDGPEGPYLCPPETGKNFLISPPGSPPVGWEQTVEDPPNSTPLADDLIIALKRLQLLDRRAPSGPELLLEGDEHAGITVYVEDCDGGRDGGKEEEAEEWVYGETMGARDAYKPSATARPPVPLAA